MWGFGEVERTHHRFLGSLDVEAQVVNRRWRAMLGEEVPQADRFLLLGLSARRRQPQTVLVLEHPLDPAPGLVRVNDAERDLLPAPAPKNAIVRLAAACLHHEPVELIARLDADAVPAELGFERIGAALVSALAGSGLDEVAVPQSREHGLGDP